jgi:DNA-binding phage protein
LPAAVTTADAYAAADRYKQTTQLQRQAREQLLAAVEANRADLNLAGVARHAGLQEKSLYRMLRREEEKLNGARPT